MALKAGTVDFVDETTITELFALTDGTIESISWQGIAGEPSFEIYTTPDGSGGAYPLNAEFGWAFAQGQSVAGATGSLYARCTDLGAQPSQPLSFFGWDAS